MSDDTNGVTADGASLAEENNDRRYWRAAISHLSNPQKRDVAWKFYLRKMEGRKSSDTISGLVLVLEANSIFLEHLPERCQQQLIAPLNRQTEGLQRLFATREERERAALATRRRSRAVTSAPPTAPSLPRCAVEKLRRPRCKGRAKNP